MTLTHSCDWPTDAFNVIRNQGIRRVATVPDAGLTRLLRMLEREAGIHVVTVATEEEGIALLAGAWIGGEKGILLIQSSGVGNTINMLSLPVHCRIPLLMLVTMRGQEGEFNPWQVPMGQATPAVLTAMGLKVFEVNDAAAVGSTLKSAAEHCFEDAHSAAVLVNQCVIGAKKFTE